MLGRLFIDFFEKEENTIEKFDKNSKIEFYFGKKYKFFAQLGIILILLCIIAFIYLVRDDLESIIIITCFLSLFLIPCIIALFIVKNKRIVYFEGKFNYINSLKKETTFNISELNDIRKPYGDGTTLFFNNKRLKFNPLLTNYKFLDEILKDIDLEKNK